MQSVQYWLLIILYFLASFCLKANASKPVAIKIDSTFDWTKTGIIYHYPDQKEIRSVNYIISLPIDSFETHRMERCNLGYLNNSNWFLIPIQNEVENNEIYVINREFLTQYQQIYLIDENQKIYKFPLQGIRIPSKNLLGNRFYAKLKLPQKGTYKIFIQIQNKYASLRPKFEIRSKKSFQSIEENYPTELQFVVFVCGFLSFVVLISVWLYFQQQKKLYLFYFLFLILNIQYILIDFGLYKPVHEYLDFLKLDPRTYNRFWLMMVAVLFSFEFNKRFIPKPNVFKKIISFLNWYIVISLLILFFIDYQFFFYKLNAKILPLIYLSYVLLFLYFPICGAL